jgi:homoserine kinase
LGSSLSGSGPSIFALCASAPVAQRVGAAMAIAFERAGGGLGADLWVSPVGRHGARIITA